jgi:hypothetical protein
MRSLSLRIAGKCKIAKSERVSEEEIRRREKEE